MTELRKVDTRNTKAPHVRHRATINRIRIPFGARILDGEIATTVCGKFLRNYWIADDSALTFTDGSIYSVECPKCFEETQ